MQTPSNTLLRPHPPAAPIPMHIAIDCDPLVPVLRLPPAIATTETVLLPTSSSRPSPSIPNLQRPQHVNPVSAHAHGEQHFPMATTFHHTQSTTEPSPILRVILPESISVPNSTQDRVSPPQSPMLSAYLSAAQEQE